MPLAAIFAACLLLSLAPQSAPAASGESSEPAAQAGSQESSPLQAPAAQPGSPQQGTKPESSTPEKAAAQTTHAKKPHKKRPANPAASSPTKRVVRNGSTPDPTAQLAPGVNPNQASHQLQNTNQLLAATEGNLKKISGRELSASQQSVVSQIHQYMEQAKLAVDGGDSERAHNLALKAHLLSEDLMKH